MYSNEVDESLTAMGKQLVEDGQEIEIAVRNPNPYITNVVRQNIAAGESWSPTITLAGLEGTNQVQLEVSSMPSINLGERLQYLLRYPYGCL